VRPGRAVLQGTIKAAEEQVRSPLKSLTCVAYYYRAWYKAQARGKWVERVVKESEVYAPSFYLAMQGGDLLVRAPASGKAMDAAKHRELMGRGFHGFQASEQIIRAGSKVTLRGRVVREGDVLCLRLRQIDLAPEAEEEGGPYRRPERRRKKRHGR
jgi:hypothetical protein